MKRIWLVLMLLSLLTAPPVPAAQKAPPAPPPQAKCPVCGMFVGKYPDWTGVIVYRDSATLYFDGAKDLFTYYLNPGKYDPTRKRADIAGISVKDYYSLASIDGRQAFYVIGGNVPGPMGKELVPFGTRADADGFLRDHRGKRILRFGEITPATLKELE
jgi:nitrous oxide reductase accessory protein NosL